MTGYLDPEIDTYVSATSTSKKLQKESEKYLPGGSSRATAYYNPYPFFVSHANGNYIYDVDGNQYLDFMMNATTYIVGHANPTVVQSVQQQAARGFSYSNPTEAQIRLAKILCDRVPSVETIRFTNSGTEGTLNAIRLARAFTGRYKIAKFEGGYHGNHEYVSVSVTPPPEKLDPSGPTSVPEWPGQPPAVANEVVVLPYNDIENSTRIIREHQKDLACVIMEPICANFGYTPGSEEFLKAIRDLTKELNILLIFDEVQSFRVSPGGAQELFGVIPDLTTFGKFIGGGMPAGAWGGRKDIMNLYDPNDGPIISHAGTFNANPMTMVAGEETLKQLTPQAYSRMNAQGHALREKLNAVLMELSVDAQVTGIGSLFGFHFTSKEITDYRSTLEGDNEMRTALFTGLLNEGILLSFKATGALTTLTTEIEIDTLVDKTRKVVQRIGK